jgi:predicted peptidase
MQIAQALAEADEFFQVLRVGGEILSRTTLLIGLGSFVLLAGFLGYLVRSEEQVGFVQRVHRDETGREWPYALFVPKGYNGNKSYPLLVYLQGSGARGVDGTKPTTDGSGPFIKERVETFDMLALFPQSETGHWEADTADGQRVVAILEEVVRDYLVDRQRIYLTGTSRGGFGVWSLAARYPHQWAAIVPICGGGDPQSAEAIKHIPCRCFHGADDNVVKVGQSRRMIEVLQAAGARPCYTEYPDVGHGFWGRAYATPELREWLRHQRLGGNLHDEPATP